MINLATLGVHTLLYGSEIDACTSDTILTDSDNHSKTTITNPNNEIDSSTKHKKKQTFVEIKVVYAENMLDLHTST